MPLLLRMRRRSLPLRNRRKRNRLQPAQLWRTKPAIRYCPHPNPARLGLPIHSILKTRTMPANPAPIATILIHPDPHLKQMGRLPERISEKRKTFDSSCVAFMKTLPLVVIFDVGGVLVDTRHSFQRTTLETVQFFAGKKVSHRELHRWKNRPGFNDDWKLSTAWVNALGKNIGYEEVKKKFVEIYWGQNGKGNAAREKWLLPAANLRRLAKLAELNVFTGRVRRE